MKKVVIQRPGGYRQLIIKQFPLPAPQDDEVLIEIFAAGVNFADVIIRQGLYKSAKEYVGWPITPGFEFSGRVLQCGKMVSGPAEGTPVFGVSRFGAYSSHICLPGHQVFPIPVDSRFTSDDWAGFPAVFLTAYHGLFQNFVLRPEMKILIHSAAGGVGGALIQLARVAGCQVTAVVGASHKIETAKEYGADEVIDKSKEDLWKRAEAVCPSGFDVVFDGNGPLTLKQSYRHLASTGKLVSYGFHSMFSKRGGFPNYFKLAYWYFRLPRWNPLHMTNDNKSIISFNLSFLFDRADLLTEAMRALTGWVEAGKIKPPVLQAFAFDKVADAHRALESGTTVGKLILKF